MPNVNFTTFLRNKRDHLQIVKCHRKRIAILWLDSNLVYLCGRQRQAKPRDPFHLPWPDSGIPRVPVRLCPDLLGSLPVRRGLLWPETAWDPPDWDHSILLLGSSSQLFKRSDSRMLHFSLFNIKDALRFGLPSTWVTESFGPSRPAEETIRWNK